MLNQQQVHSDNQVEDRLAEALATARKMQQDWLTYGLDFVRLYVEDVDGDWLDTWGEDEVKSNYSLDEIKEFLVSDQELAVKIRANLGEKSLFDLAVNLEESLIIPVAEERLTSVRNLLATFNVEEIESNDIAEKIILILGK
ncbi:MAG TPA: hypothetical protein VK203_27905 [Nostocaceae cyanobacterium]|nr:hypothetical protein [Nostocaceae cyanobacterium]